MQSQLPVLRPDAQAQAILKEMSGRLEDRLYGPIREVGYDAPPPVLTKSPAPLAVRYTEHGTTLTAARYDLDPLILEDGGLIRAPDSERKKLEALRKAGINPDLVWVLRELPGRWQAGEQPPRMIEIRTAETARTRHVQHLQVGAAAFVVGRALLYTAGAAFVLVTGATVALGAITIAAAGAVAAVPLAAGLDPMLLGGLVDERTGAVAWVPLAAWDEVPDERRW